MIAGSPDGIFEDGIIEIKCPISAKTCGEATAKYNAQMQIQIKYKETIKRVLIKHAFYNIHEFKLITHLVNVKPIKLPPNLKLKILIILHYFPVDQFIRDYEHKDIDTSVYDKVDDLDTIVNINDKNRLVD
ncbi:hypothetical protein NQ317_011240 [Molorchus minor]|uniref:YqaJ viral recombinase domain-containing protein n=1 Tax=Molorchus minor TaxID=1323400 RepID=A0ABQ9J8U6_9CUCU|nr:hypothetical protein NQ317_011240 [Molorchus minor]